MKPNLNTLKPAVVIPAYRRHDALRRLLRSVNEADYPDAGCTLIISLEGGAEEEVIRVAEDFEFQHGDKEIVRHSDKLGLKAHIYECAGYSQKYGSIIVLEEDLVVSPAYYHFAVRALQAYQNSESVAGISLYAQRFNETAQLPFEPMPSYFAGYFMKLACSWGQAWTAEQWEAYQKWARENPVPLQIDDIRIPKNIREWPAESWKREFNCYLLQKGRTIFYPYHSLTTNSSHYGGEHMKGTGSLFEVPLVHTIDGLEYLQFPKSENATISYDLYMEANGSYVENVTGFNGSEVTLDLYGTKPLELLKKENFIFTSKKIDDPIQSYALKLKPIEWNLKNHLKDHSTNAFFSLVESKKIIEYSVRRWAYIQLAIHCGTNRLGSSRLVWNNLLFQLKEYLKS